MSSFDKVVKLACKPKAAPPKAKYIDPIIAATWSDDGAVHDVCKALAPRIREPNTIVAFKALIVLHTMIRNGATDNVLSYLSSSEVLRLRNVSTANWEGYTAPQNIQAYATYLDSRIRGYKDLKHDVVKVQAESNRDMRNSASVEEEGYRGRGGRNQKPIPVAPTRSKTLMGRKLRSMTVEKGLLRETKAVHNMIDAVVECRFYADDLEDELTITALRMLVKDLLILFQAGNEGVINVLENYFEMSHVDAEEALRIYRHFCKQTEAVVEYLGVAKKLQNLLNVPVPNLKHAPVSLAGALQEYLNDPNFEQNRLEYRANKGLSEKGSKSKTNGKRANPPIDTMPTIKVPSTAVAGSSDTARTSGEQSKTDNNNVTDFFAAIEEEQPTTFNPQTNRPHTAFFPQQGLANPFSHMNGTGSQNLQQTIPTFILPQTTATPQQPNPFGNMLAPQPTGHRPFSSYIPAQTNDFLQQQQQLSLAQQQTGFPQQPQQPTFPQQPQQPGFAQLPQPQPRFLQQQPQQTGLLQPQMTGSNPFRQSMLMPQSTGMQLFGVTNGVQAQGALGTSTSLNSGLPSFGNSLGAAPFAPKPTPFRPNAAQGDVLARPASTPLTSGNSASPPLQFVKTHQTGTRNPFGPVAAPPPPPVPRAPTLFELSSGISSMNSNQAAQNQTQQQQVQTTSGFSFANSALNPGPTDMASVASSFAFSKPNTGNDKPSNSAHTPSPLTQSSISNGLLSASSTSTFSDSVFSSLAASQTGATNSTQPSSLSPQMTGFTGLKPFKPTSSFGASLLESLPAVSGSTSSTPVTTGPTSGLGGGGLAPSSATSPSFLSSPPPGSATSNLSFLNSQRTGATNGFGGGSTLGVGLRPQMTGGGGANPFRASMAAPTSGGTPNFSAFQTKPGLPSFNPTTFGSTAFNIPQQQGQQQTNSTSLI